METLLYIVQHKGNVTNYDRPDGLCMTDEEWERICLHVRLNNAKPCWMGKRS